MTRLFLIAFTILLSSNTKAQSNLLEPQFIGPKKGALVIVGGAMRSDAILDRFIELAGGNSAEIVVIPTAGGQGDYNDDFYFVKRLKERGVQNVTLLHTRDPELAIMNGTVMQVAWRPGRTADLLNSGRNSIRAITILLQFSYLFHHMLMELSIAEPAFEQITNTLEAICILEL